MVDRDKSIRSLNIIHFEIWLPQNRSDGHRGPRMHPWQVRFLEGILGTVLVVTLPPSPFLSSDLLKLDLVYPLQK